MNIPNILTLFRLVAALFIGVPFLIWSQQPAAIITLLVFAFASATDYVDGYLARKWDQISELGRMMDPIADKAMVVITLGVLAAVIGLKAIYVLPMSVIMFREIFVSGMREFLGDRAVNLKVTQLAKWKTATQMAAIVMILLGFALGAGSIGATVLGFGIFALWIAAALTLITGIDYARKAVELLE